MKRILVIGNSGAGKSTLSKRLSDRLHVPFFPSDPFYWEPGWRAAPADKVFRQLREVIAQEAWILDGNFDEHHEFVWRHADCIIWLDYSLPTITKQIISRNFKWLFLREPVWPGNKMTLRKAVSGIRHAIRSYPLKRRNYPCWLAELSSIPHRRFRTKQETEAWLQSLY
jgi:hypothetical protein